MLRTISLPLRAAPSRTSGDTITSCPSKPPVAMTYSVIFRPLASQIACFTCPASWPSLVRTLASWSIGIAVLLFGERRLSRIASASPGLQRDEDRDQNDHRADVGL